MAIVATHVAAVQELYVAYFGRPADPAGLDYWTNIVEAQGSTAAVSATFAESDEYQDAFEGMTNTQIVNQIYQNMFGREAEASGRDYWVKLLDEGKITVDNIVADVAKAAVGTDGEAVENKVAAATAFTAALDTDAEVAGYAGEDALALAKAFIKGVTTDASLATATAPAALNATVAAVVAAGTEFTLEGAMANLVAAQEARSEVLQTLAEDSAVAKQLGNIKSPTDAQISNAIDAVVASVEGKIDGILPDFSEDSAAMQAARISDEQAALTAARTAANRTLTTRTEAVADIDGLEQALAATAAADEAFTAANTAAELALIAETSAVANLKTLNAATGAISVNLETAVAAQITTSTGTTTLVTYDARTDTYSIPSSVTAANYEGLAAAVAAMNARQDADAERAEALELKAEAALAADILDNADNNAQLKLVAAAMKLTPPAANTLPSLAEIRAEADLFDARIVALDAAAVADGAANYQAVLNTLATNVGNATGATPADVTAAAKVFTDAAVTKGYITAADATEILKAAGVPATAVTAVAANNWEARETTFDNAVSTLITQEGGTLNATTGVWSDASLGTASDNFVAAQKALATAEENIENLADAVAEYEAAQELVDARAAAQKAIDTAAKVFTDEGYVKPVALTANITATAKADVFLAADTNVTIRNFGSLGDDVLYVGKGLTYNDTEIGSGTGQVDLDDAGDNAVLEFFLQQDGNDVLVIIENEIFGSDSGSDIATIRLTGVDLEDITVANGFITV